MTARRYWMTGSLLGISVLLTGCGPEDGPNILDPRGPAAAEIASLWWLMFWLGLAVFIAAFALLLYAIFDARRRGPEAAPDAVGGERLILWGGVIIPIPILLIVLMYTLTVGEATTLSGRALGADVEPNVTIDVIGHQFWWEVRYLQEEVVTANEIHIPVGEPVLFRLASADVIHSFWVPQLHGKVDLVPGTTNTIRLQADEPGVYRGICAEFCGAQHAHMHFLIVAQPADEFVAWLEHQRQPAVRPTDEVLLEGQQVFLGAACIYCHAIRGVNEEPVTTIGPDLTHLASRRTLAAGMLENNRGNLGGWVLDPQGIKPGNRMPSTRLNSEDFFALLSYLESLR